MIEDKPNGEIKEILNKLKETADYPKINYSSYDKSFNETIDNVAMIKSFACKQLLDYITNLQQENIKLISENEAIKNIKYTVDEVIYKSRIDKAIEFVETNPLIWKPNMELSKLIENPDLKGRLFYTADEWLNKLHTIIKGDDEK